jgi:GntR family transcriptional regulator
MGTHVCTRIDPNEHGCTTGDLAIAVLDNDSPVPLHEQLSAMLREQIVRGRLTGRVPSILSLAQEHGVSHRTAARALTTLRDEDLIISVRGKGYYVR